MPRRAACTIDRLDLGKAVLQLHLAGQSSKSIAAKLAEAGVRLAPRTVRWWLRTHAPAPEDREQAAQLENDP